MLEEQSLLHQVRDRSGNVRYELHSMVRQFVSEQLAQRPVLREQATTRYCRYYIELLASLKTALLNEASAQQQVWLELENIRAAWAQCVDQGQIALLGQGLDALANFYETAGLINEAAQVFQTAIICVRRRLAHQATEDHVPLLARLLATSARFYCLLGQFEKCESAATEAIAIGQHIDIPIAQALAYQELTRAAYARGQYSAMHTLAEQGLAIASRTGALGIEAALLNLLGVALGVQGKYQGAIEHNLAALACLQQAPNAHQEASVTAHLGFMYSYRREFTLALHYATRSITLAHTFNSIYNLGVSYILLGDLWRELGFYGRAQQAYEQAQPHIQTLQVGYWQAWWAVSSGHLALAQGNASAAYKHYTTALTLAQEGQMVSVERWALTSLGHWQAAQGEVAEAEQCYRNALTIQQQANLVMNVTDAMAGLAELYLARQEFTTAQTFVEEILSYLTQYGLLVAEAPFQVYQTCYRVLKANCDPRALEVLQQAQSLLLEQAANLQDETVRRSFLQNVAVNQALLTLARSHCNLSRVALYPFNAPAKRPRINNLPKAR
jgi:tetratricopeptide (TPR) repeat protein